MPPHPIRLEPDTDRWDWYRHAACQGESLTLFYGSEGERVLERVNREERAKQVCRVCPVVAECLEEALRDPGQHGIWAGLSPEDRASLRRQRLREARAA